MLSNTATPRYYGAFRDAVIAGQIPVCREIEMEMHRIDALIANPGVYYDDRAVEGFIAYCNEELTLTDGSDLKLMDSFKLWAESIFGWYYFVEQMISQLEVARELIGIDGRVMSYWMNLISSEIRLVQAVIRRDRERFGKLQ